MNKNTTKKTRQHGKSIHPVKQRSDSSGKKETIENEPSVPASGMEKPFYGMHQGSSSRMSRYAIILLFVAVSIAIFPIIKLFIIPIILAATFTTLCYPLYNVLLKLAHGNRPMASIATCILLVLCGIVPAYVVMHLIVVQLIQFYQAVEPMMKQALTVEGTNTILNRVQLLIPVTLVNVAEIDFSNLLSGSIKSVLTLVSKAVNKTSAGFFEIMSTLIITFFTMFYFFLDGEKLVQRIKFLSPIRDDYEEMIISRFLLISRASVMGTIVIGIVQGTLGAVTLLIFGVDSWLLWGFVMVMLSIIPLVGAWLVLIPAGLFQLFNGHLLQGIGIIAVCVIVVSNVDNLIRPRLVGKEAKLHDLVIFFSSIGGIVAFGVMGFVVGPVVAALFIAVLDIYGTEFEQQLEDANKRI